MAARGMPGAVVRRAGAGGGGRGPPVIPVVPRAGVRCPDVPGAGREAGLFGAGHLVRQRARARGGSRQHRRRIPPTGAHHARTPAGGLRLRRHQPLRPAL